MKKQILTQTLITLMTLISCGLTQAGVNSNPEDMQKFRDQMHRDYSATSPNSITPVIPELYPAKSYSSVSAAKTTANFDDLLISETVGPANFRQMDVDLAGIKGRGLAAVWSDNRDGANAVYLQLFDNAGGPIGGNVALVSGIDFDLSQPQICSDTNGYFYVVWREEVNGFLQAARFDSTGVSLGPIFFVSDTVAVSYSGEFDAACLDDGRLAVTWESYSIGSDILLQVFDIDGSRLGSLTTVNSDGSFSTHLSPAIAVGPNDEIAVSWEDDRSGTADIYFRRFTSSGTPLDPEIQISDLSARNSARYIPSVVFSSINGYLVGWVDLRSGQNLYLQKISTAGSLIGSNFLISDESSDFLNWGIKLAVNSNNSLLASWTQYGTDNHILLQRFNSGLFKDGPTTTVSSGTGNQRFGPAVAANQAGTIALLWTDRSNFSFDIRGVFLAEDGSVIRAEFTTNDDTVGSPSFDPDVVRFNNFDWGVVFADSRRDDGDIMLQQVYIGGLLTGSNRQINTDPAGGVQTQPSISSAAGKMCISWTDVRDNGSTGQNIVTRFSKFNYDLTPEITVNDDFGGSAAHYQAHSAITNSGVTLIIWTDTRQGSPRTFGQLFDAQNDPIDGNFLIGPSSPTHIGEMAAVSVDSVGRFIVSYLNRLASGSPVVEVKSVSVSGNVVDLFSFSSDQVGYKIDGYDVGVNHDGNIILVWHAFGQGQLENFLTVFNSAGSILTSSLGITDDNSAEPEPASMSVDPSGFVLITWMDHRTGRPTPFRQVFEPSLTPLQGNVPTYSAEGPNMQSPVTAASRGRGIFVWADARADGLNIYASQELYSPTATDDNQFSLPSNYNLKQNYPNPFNPTTTISFSLPEATQVSLEIFNVLGQKIKTILDAAYPAGYHQVNWDGVDDTGSKVASGIYLYRLKTEQFSHARRMVLMK